MMPPDGCTGRIIERSKIGDRIDDYHMSMVSAYDCDCFVGQHERRPQDTLSLPSGPLCFSAKFTYTDRFWSKYETNLFYIETQSRSTLVPPPFGTCFVTEWHSSTDDGDYGQDPKKRRLR